MSSRYVVYKRILAKICRRLKCTKMIVKSFMTFDLYFRDGPDIRFSIRPFFSYLVSGRISDIKTGYPVFEYPTCLLLVEDLRYFNYLSNSVEQRTGIEISGIGHPPDIRPEIRFSERPNIR